jgi:hypothetical protein
MNVESQVALAIFLTAYLVILLYALVRLFMLIRISRRWSPPKSFFLLASFATVFRCTHLVLAIEVTHIDLEVFVVKIVVSHVAWTLFFFAQSFIIVYWLKNLLLFSGVPRTSYLRSVRRINFAHLSSFALITTANAALIAVASLAFPLNPRYASAVSSYAFLIGAATATALSLLCVTIGVRLLRQPRASSAITRRLYLLSALSFLFALAFVARAAIAFAAALVAEGDFFGPTFLSAYVVAYAVYAVVLEALPTLVACVILGALMGEVAKPTRELESSWGRLSSGGLA